MWELPLCRALAYQHCALWQAGAWTIAPQPSPEAQLAQLDQLSNLEILEDE